MLWEETEEASLDMRATLLVLVPAEQVPAKATLNKPHASLCPNHFFLNLSMYNYYYCTYYPNPHNHPYGLLCLFYRWKTKAQRDEIMWLCLQGHEWVEWRLEPGFANSKPVSSHMMHTASPNYSSLLHSKGQSLRAPRSSFNI